MTQDRGIHIVSWVLIVSSTCLSGYFGWVSAEGVFPLNWVLMLMCASVPFAVSWSFERGAGYSAYGMRGHAIGCWVFGLCFMAANMLFDYSSAAAVRDAVSTSAKNQNTRADDARSTVERLTKNINDAKATSAWQASLKPPAAYEDEIRNLEGNRTIMERSKNCADQTRPDTKDHCQRITDARASLAMAQQRIVTAKQIERWETELGQALTKSENVVHHANPAVAQVKSIVSWFIGSRNLSEDNIFWGQNAVMLFMAILVNLGLAFLGHEIGTMRARRGGQFDFAPDYPPPPPRQLAYHPQYPQGPAPALPSLPATHTTTETIVLAATDAPPAAVRHEDQSIAEMLHRAKTASDDVARRLAAMKTAGSA